MTVKRGKKKAAPPKLKRPMSAQEFLKGVQAQTKESDQFSLFSDNIFASVEERIPTGVFALDRITGGGWPVGRMVEVAAWEGVGKSTLLDQSIAQVQRMGGIAALIDTEGARDLRYMERLGVNPAELLHARADTIEGCFKCIEDYLDFRQTSSKTHEQKPMLIVWDSVGGTPTQAEIDGAADDVHVMGAARSIKLNMRRLHHRFASLRVALVCTNHFYRTIGPFAQLKTYGGSGIQYFASLRIWLTRKGTIKVGTDPVGHEVELKIKKTRIGVPGPPEVAGLISGSGFDNAYTLFHWALLHGEKGDHRFINQRGAWYTFSRSAEDPEPLTFQRGFAGFGAILDERRDVYEMLVDAYLKTDAA